jgi:uncharacterized protein (UPF0332 family)
VKRGLVAAELGRSLNRAHELRMVADYRGDTLEASIVAGAIADGESFLQAMGALVEAQPSR